MSTIAWADRGVAPPAPGVRITSPAPRGAWRDTLATDPDAVVTQTPEWSDWLCQTRGYTDASRLYEFPDGRRLVLPLLARVVGGVRLAEESMPYGFGYGGPLVSGGRPTEHELSTVLRDLARRPALRTSLVPVPITASRWATAALGGAGSRTTYLSHVLDLRDGFDVIWARRYRKTTRKKVTRARRLGVEVRYQDSGCVAAFAELNRRSVERWARQRGQPLPLARLVERRRNRAAQLTSASMALSSFCATWSAHWAGEPAAACATLQHGAHVTLWLSAVDRRLADETGAGFLLHSQVIEAACCSGARWLHLGESDPGSGVEQFKASLGATPIPGTAIRFERLPLTATEHLLRTAVARACARRTAQ